jgi:putative heme-binding domain-containing protein
MRGLAKLLAVAVALMVLGLAGCSPPSKVESPPPSPLAAQVVTNRVVELPRRRAAVFELAKTEAGARALIKDAQDGLLAADLRVAAGLELSHLPWPDLAIQGTQLLMPPCGVDNRPLPRLPELAARRGNAANGEKVFRRPEVNCIGCHVVNGQGVVLASDLSDIGLKMDREGLWENILDPSAVVTPGFETWQVVMKNEDEYVGVLVKESAEELGMRDAKNNLIQLKVADIKHRRMLTVSLMPSNLYQTMTLEELADVVEYLAGLRKSAAGKVAERQ